MAEFAWPDGQQAVRHLAVDGEGRIVGEELCRIEDVAQLRRDRDELVEALERALELMVPENSLSLEERDEQEGMFNLLARVKGR